MAGGVGAAVRFGILGPLTIVRDGAAIEIKAPKQRALLTHLVANAGHTVSTDRLIEGLWGQDAPGQARLTLRSYLSNLRQVLDHPGAKIVARSNGYVLEVDPAAVDAVRFERLVTSARDCVGRGEARRALQQLDEALGLWRGEALADAADSVLLRGDIIRLEELRRSAKEDRNEALLLLANPAEVVACAQAFVEQEPLRERARAQLMLALYRVGRAPDALLGFREFRQLLAGELGLDPSPHLQRLADHILIQSPELDGPAREDVERPPPVPEAAAVAESAGRQPPATARPHDRLVGRQHERSELADAVGRLEGGEGGLLLVVGEPGIGKTSLLEHLATAAAVAGVQTCWGRCPETEGAPAFWPWVQVLRAVADEATDEQLSSWITGPAGPVTQLVETIAERVGGGQGAAGSDPEARFALYDAVSTFLRRATRHRPAVVVLDDLHWADPPSLQLLAFLAPQLSTARLLIAASYRNVLADWSPELADSLASLARVPTLQQIGLAGLLPSDLAEVAAQVTGEQLPDDQAHQLWERTGGNPFFARQLAQLLRETGGRAAPDTTIPTGVRHVIARRLGMLSADVRAVLEVAAVIGREFDLGRLATAAGVAPDDVLGAAGQAAVHGLLEPVGRPTKGYRFVHALVRETIDEGLAPQRAARLHAQVADALERLPGVPAAELAEHFWHAADLIQDDRPVSYLLAAADEALGVLAFEQAESYLRRALRLTGRDQDPVRELRIRARLVQLLIGYRGWARDLVEEVAGPAVQLAREAGLRPEVLPFWVALLSTYTAPGGHATAKKLAEELFDLAVVADDPAALAASHSTLAYVDVFVGRDLSDALEHLALAERFAESAPPEHLQATPHVWVATVYLQAVALAFQGHVVRALEAAHRSIALAERVADPFSRAMACRTAALVGVLAERPEFVAEVAGPGKRLSERHGYGSVARLITISESWARARLEDDPGEHAERMREAVEVGRGFQHADPTAKCLLFTAETFLLAGDPVVAAGYLDDARSLSHRTGEFLPPERLRRIDAELAALTERT